MSLAQRSAMADESERLRARIDTLEAQVTSLGVENARLRGLIPTQREHAQGWGN